MGGGRRHSRCRCLFHRHCAQGLRREGKHAGGCHPGAYFPYSGADTALCRCADCGAALGLEGQHTPSPKQRRIARLLSEGGVDLIVGHQPHEVQSYERIGQAHVLYSVGNFIHTPRSVAADVPPSCGQNRSWMCKPCGSSRCGLRPPAIARPPQARSGGGKAGCTATLHWYLALVAEPGVPDTTRSV